MISVVLALLTAASNATASVLQRRAASQTKATRQLGGFSLLRDLARRRVWLAGIAMVVVASLLQAGALATGPIALVQPIFIVELPLALLLSSWVWHRKLSRRTWGAVALVTVSLGAGLAAACGYSLTAALMKEAVAALDQGVVAFFETWQLYGVAIAGVGSLLLLQNALQAGTLAASQPALTVGDALLSTVYGVMLFHETLRLGWWLIPEIVCLGLIVVGYIEIAKSPVAMAHDESEPSPPVQAADAAPAGQHAGAAAETAAADTAADEARSAQD